jgi:hypothetical protein
MWKVLAKNEKQLARWDLENMRKQTPEEIEQRVNDFFDWCKVHGEPITMSGVAMVIGVDTTVMREYNEDDAYLQVIKKSRQKVENYMERHLFSGKNPIGAIFLLKNHFGYKDRQDINITTETISDVLSKAKKRDAIDADVVEDKLLAQHS